jgi:hypothetical protein
MPIFIIGLMALVLCVYGLRTLGRASPAQVAQGVRSGGGLLALAAAFLVLLRGRFLVALGLGGLSFYLFSGERLSFEKLGASLAALLQERRRARKRSQAQTATLAMTLDHVTGDVDGEVRAGPFAGRKLSQMSREECDALYRHCLGSGAGAASDPEAARLLETYFDRRFAGWRAAGEGDANAGDGARARRGGGEMSEQEAYQTLGLGAGASAEEIIRAHRRLMKERHPDHGGTTDDAARINQAKDRLLRRHG